MEKKRNYYFNDNIIIGFYKECDPIIIEKDDESHPRIFIGIEVDNKIKKFGYGVIPMGNRKLKLSHVFREIDYPVKKCDINFKWMENRDISILESFCK